MRPTYLFFLLFSVVVLAQPQNIIIPPENIKTVQFFNPKTNDLTPIVKMGNKLLFSFDDLETGYKSYNYTIEHYDRNWQKSDLFQSDYLNGYTSDLIRDYTNSFNTLLPYTHYQLEIPNQNMQPKISGNYVLSVFVNNQKTPLFQKAFSVYESLSDVGISIDRNPAIDGYNQRVEVRVASRNLNLTQTPDATSLFILKNNNWNNFLRLDNPVFAQPDLLTYNQMDNLFQGGYEYNYFDTKNIQAPGMKTQRVVRDSIYQTVLFADAYNNDDVYVDNPDVNGNYYIRNILIGNPNNAGSEADYSNVFFALAYYTPEADEQICIYGAFTNFECTPESRLEYVPENDLYETKMLLKQGYYNYSYAIEKPDGTIDYTAIPGSYWQTENLYQALVYYRPWGKRYDLLIGYGEGYSRPSLR